MTARETMAHGPHFWWCHVHLRPHTPRCTCPPDQLAAAVERDRLIEVARVAVIVGEAK